MYGFIHCCLQDLVLREYNEETWKTIIKTAGVNLEGGEYMIHRVYSDQETLRLVNATCTVSGLKLNVVLECFGKHFFRYCVESGYDRLLKVLGRTLREFLSNLDALHDHLAAIYPGMNAPSFRTTERDDGGLNLHYYSSRKGLGYIVIGIVKAVARECLHTEIEIAADKEKHDHLTFVIYEKTSLKKLHLDRLISNSPSKSPKIDRFTNIFKSKKQFMKIESFCEAFPFHVVFDRKLKLRQCGKSVIKYIDSNADALKFDPNVSKLTFLDTFDLVRPIIDFTFESVLAHINTVFVVSSKHSLRKFQEIKKKVRRQGSKKIKDHIKYSNIFTENLIPKSTSFNMCQPAVNLLLSAAYTSLSLTTPQAISMKQTTELRLKGQMIYLPKTDRILFLCSPRVSSFDELEQRGLFLSDVPLHDATRKLILATQAQQEDRQLVQRIEDSNNDLKILKSNLVHKREITDDLLHELLPKNVAAQLRLNKPVRSEQYDVVSTLFTDIVGFTALCSNEKVVPMDIIELLNNMYTSFDALSSLYKIYKVETIGDAYMGVTGIPNSCSDHAHNVARMAWELIKVIQTVKSPVDKKHVQIRIGLHSGPVMAGVVGRKMPRYCLFGKTVTIGNKMESGSSPGKINVSEDFRKYLNEDEWMFSENTNANPIKCYFISKKEELNIEF